jgi:hypothetical protein
MAHSSKMVDVTGFRKADYRMNKNVGATLTSRSDSELSVGTVHRVTGLKRYDFSPCEFLEMTAQLRRGVCLCPTLIVNIRRKKMPNWTNSVKRYNHNG